MVAPWRVCYLFTIRARAGPVQAELLRRLRGGLPLSQVEQQTRLLSH